MAPSARGKAADVGAAPPRDRRPPLAPLPLERRDRCVGQSVGVGLAITDKLQNPDGDKLDNGHGVTPVSFNRAQACLNARFIASRRSSSLNVASPRTARP